MKNKYINKKSATAFLSILIMLFSFAPKANAQSFTEGFENLGTLVDWYSANNSDSVGLGWFKGQPLTFFPAQAGTDSSYIAANFQSTTAVSSNGANISNWLFTPNRVFNNGDVISFYTRTVVNPAQFVDNLQVRFSGNGTSLNVGTTSASVGDFTTLLLEINPTLSTTVYPAVWTQYTITISGLGGATSGRVAFRYVVPNGGAGSTTKSYYIGIDTYSYTSNTSVTDATVSNVYTLGTIAKPFINPHVVTARITNSGTTTLTNKVVTLNVTGANVFTNTQTIATLAAGASAIVTFAGYTSNNAGTNTVTVSVPADAVATGNTVSVTQTVNTNSYNYAYGNIVDNGVGFPTTTGDVAVKFNTSSATTISSVNVNNNVAGQPIHVDIWDATGAGGTPGTLLYSSASLNSIVGVQPVTVSPAVAVNGAFYVGLTQEGITNMAVSDQVENPVRLTKFYFRAPTGTGTWTDFSGVVEARVMIEPVFASCSSAPAQPGAISGTTTVCQGTSQTYSVSAVTGATSYNWTLPSGWSGSSTSNTITSSAGASSGTVTVSATNSCGTSTLQTLTVTVNPVPSQPGTINGNNTVCPSSSNTYSVAAVTGATSYTWTLPGGWSGTSTTNSITTMSGATGGNITVTANNACGSSINSILPVTVSSAPPQPGVITGPTTFCNGSSNTYSIAAIAGATSYTWTLPSGWSGNSTTNTITAIASANGGVVSVTYTNACGTSPAQQLTVTVGSAPSQPGTISGVTTFCPGQQQVYSINTVSGATSYSWTLPSGWSGSSNITSITATTVANGGTVSVTATNACGTSAAQTLIVSLGTAPAQPGAITGNANICSGGTQTYSVSQVAGAISYVWSLPAGWQGGSNSNSITTITNATSGVVSVAAVNDCGTSTMQTLTVTVNSVPSQPTSITGLNAVCSGISGVYSIPAVTGATSYTWTLPGGWSGSSTSNSITATANGGSGNILVTVTNACGTSPSQFLNVTVSSAAPAQPGTIAGNPTMCSAATTTYTVANVSGATSYNWTLPGGWTGTSTTNSITVTVGTTGGSITVAAANGCGTSSAQTLAVTVNQSPAQPAVINGTALICGSGSQTYSVATVGGATSYTWTPPSGWSGSSITNTITYTPGSSGTISVTANNSTCSSPAQTLAVTVGTVPATPGAITGSASVCSGASETYSIGAVTGATSYTWTLPGGWTGTSTTNSITSTVGTTGGNITVTATNSCGTSSAQTLAVTATLTLAQPGAIAGANPACAGSTQTYSIAPVAGAVSYTWTLPGGWTGTSSVDSITVVVGTSGTGNLQVSATNSCGTSPTQGDLITVNALPPIPTITVAGNILQSSSATGNQWDTTGVAVSGATGQFFTMFGAGIYSVTVTANGCSSTSAFYTNHTGINDNELDNLFSVYPNPSHDVINIQLTANKTVEAASITNVLGKTLIVINPKNIKGNDVLAVDVKDLSQGIYFLSLQVEGRMITKKIIVE